MPVITVINNKGGVTKTTSTFTLGSYFASKGLKVLLLDFDPQLSLTEKALQYEDESNPVDYTVLDFISNSGKRSKFFVDESGYMYTMKGTKELNAFFGVNRLDGEKEYNIKRNLFKDKISLLKSNFDIILIDCAPGMFDEHLLTPNEAALLGADYVLIPIGTDNDTISGIMKVAATIKRIKPENKNLQLLGVFFALVKTEERLYTEFRDALKEKIGDLLIDAPIRRSADMLKALAANETIWSMAPKSIAAQDYQQLGDNILQKLKIS